MAIRIIHGTDTSGLGALAALAGVGYGTYQRNKTRALEQQQLQVTNELGAERLKAMQLQNQLTQQEIEDTNQVPATILADLFPNLKNATPEEKAAFAKDWHGMSAGERAGVIRIRAGQQELERQQAQAEAERTKAATMLDRIVASANSEQATIPPEAVAQIEANKQDVIDGLMDPKEALKNADAIQDAYTKKQVSGEFAKQAMDQALAEAIAAQDEELVSYIRQMQVQAPDMTARQARDSIDKFKAKRLLQQEQAKQEQARAKPGFREQLASAPAAIADLVNLAGEGPVMHTPVQPIPERAQDIEMIPGRAAYGAARPPAQRKQEYKLLKDKISKFEDWHDGLEETLLRVSRQAADAGREVDTAKLEEEQIKNWLSRNLGIEATDEDVEIATAELRKKKGA